jgi:hypothetical protein
MSVLNPELGEGGGQHRICKGIDRRSHRSEFRKR